MNNSENNTNLNNNSIQGVSEQNNVNVSSEPNIVSSIPVVNPTEVGADVLNAAAISNNSENSDKNGASQPISPTVLPQTVQTSGAGVDLAVSQVRDDNQGNVGVSNISTDGNNDPGALVNENLKKVEIEYTPPSKGRTVFTIMMFVFIIGFVIFLPDITSLINDYKANKYAVKEEVITTGKLECTLNSNTTNLDMNYSRIFKYTDSKLDSADYTITTRGDVTLDEATLNDMAAKCKILEKYTDGVNGVDVSCSYTDGKLVEKQSYVFSGLNTEELDAAFAESGGTYPDFKAGQSIESIEKTMNAAGYSCIRKK